MSPGATFTRFFNPSRDGDSPTALGSLFQCLTTLSGKKFFLIFNLNLPWCNLRPLLLVLSLVTGEKRPTPPHYTLLSGGWRELSGPPSALSSPDWTVPAPSSLSSADLFSTPLSLIALLTAKRWQGPPRVPQTLQALKESRTASLKRPDVLQGWSA